MVRFKRMSDVAAASSRETSADGDGWMRCEAVWCGVHCFRDRMVSCERMSDVAAASSRDTSPLTPTDACTASETEW